MRRDREDILTAAGRYFSRNGFRTTSMQEMAEALDVSRSSLYYHFTEKSDLLYELLVRLTDEFAERAREIVRYPLTASQRLAVLVHAVLKLQVENPAVPLSLVLRSDEGSALKSEQRQEVIRRRDVYEGFFRQLIDEGVEAGEFRAVNTKLTTFALLGALEEFEAWYDPEGPLNPDQIADVFVDLFLTSLANDHPPGPFSERPTGASAADGTPPRRRRTTTTT